MLDAASKRRRVRITSVRFQKEHRRQVARVSRDWAHVITGLRRPGPEGEASTFHRRANLARFAFAPFALDTLAWNAAVARLRVELTSAPAAGALALLVEFPLDVHQNTSSGRFAAFGFRLHIVRRRPGLFGPRRAPFLELQRR